MTELIKRGEAKNLDALFIANLGLANSKTILRKDLLIKGVKYYDIQIPSYMVEDYSSISQGRYLRTITDALLSLGFCVDINRKSELQNCIIDSTSDIQKIKKFVQYNNSVFKPTQESIKFSKTKFSSENWRSIFLSQLLKFGYFVRYLDLIDLLKNISEDNKTNIIECSNLLGPYDDIVKGGGPSFVQKPFLTWAFFSGAINFNTGSLSTYSIEKRLEYLANHRGVFDRDNRILNSFKSFSCNIMYESKKVNIPSFIRFANLQSWKYDRAQTFFESLLKVRIIYLLDKETMSIKDIKKDKIVLNILSKLDSDISIIKLILSIETMGMKYTYNNQSITAHILKMLFKKDEFLNRINHTPKSQVSPLFDFIDKYSSSFNFDNYELEKERSFDKKIFETSLPKGNLVWSTLNV